MNLKAELIVKESDFEQIQLLDSNFQSLQNDIMKLLIENLELQYEIVIAEALFRIGICFADKNDYIEFLKTQVTKSEKDEYLTFYYQNKPFLRVWFDLEINNELLNTTTFTNQFNYKFL